MRKVSETGHNKNVANFKALLTIATEMGALYQPMNRSIELAQLQPVVQQLDGCMTAMEATLPAFWNAQADRVAVFAELNRRSASAVNAFCTLRVAEGDKEHVKSILKKIRPTGGRKKVDPEKDNSETISTSQQSYDNRAANFGLLVAQLRSRPAYAPNETELRPGALEDFHERLLVANQEMARNTYSLLTARTQRNEALYTGQDSVLVLQREIKGYLKSLGSKGAAYYKAATRLTFSYRY